jgi:hypothetical protein
MIVSVFDYSGKVINEMNVPANQTKVNISLDEFSAGIYFVKVSNDSFYRIEKLVKQ